ncbi:ACP S-malonyltransferase [Xenorhabdus sp. PB62.4]|uniref:ACP S-malonyltransferase n=1 Tax=Xenorhabdus sp. PB62.4 TaxID=1851573 RepID=UPI001656D9A3|nr:ACP S-malonyltransferase [Xenorhabdus sp. PB62.4]MBC8951928.1 Thioesterase [Xenorhabdus sp. PB62.4]
MECILFPGQGIQTKGMGEALFEKYPDMTALACDILGYDLKRICLENPDGLLNCTQYTQPCIYLVNALYYQAHLQNGGQRGDILLGHSLGEYNALLAAGAFDFETGLKLVAKRGELMGAVQGGAMLAVVGIEEPELRECLMKHHLDELDIANYNTPTQYVLSGPSEKIERAGKILEQRVRQAVKLNVSAAYHSRYMEPARKEFAAFLKGFHFNPLSIPVIANISALPYENKVIAHTLSEQITGSVRWVESIRHVIEKGESCAYREMGNSQILSRMVNQIEKINSPVSSLNRHSSQHPQSIGSQNSTDKMPLFCLPYAGADERAYTGLAEHCRFLDVITLERPGRGKRHDEPLLSDADSIVDDILKQLAGRLDRPFALYGHSLGALLAYSLCCRLRKEGLPLPVQMFVSGSGAPSVPSREHNTWQLPSDAFWQHLREMGGVPDELLEFKPIMGFFEPILRADFSALGNYVHCESEPLPVPITTLNGDKEWFSAADIQAWQRETMYPLNLHQFSGDHFFIRSHWQTIGQLFESILLLPPRANQSNIDSTFRSVPIAAA